MSALSEMKPQRLGQVAVCRTNVVGTVPQNVSCCTPVPTGTHQAQAVQDRRLDAINADGGLIAFSNERIDRCLGCIASWL